MCDKDILNVTDLSELFGVDVQTIYRLTRENKIPHFKLNGQKGKILFLKTSIDNWVQEKEKETMQGVK